MRKNQAGRMFKSRQILTSRALAPGNETTLEQLRESRRLQCAPEPLLHDVRVYEPAVPVGIEFLMFVQVLKSAPRGSAPGPGDTINELLKIALDDEDTAALLHKAVVQMARARIPASISNAFMAARMTALKKPDGRVHGIATGTAFRRLVASCLARVVGKEVEAACAPFQYALSTRAGTECVAHLFRAACDLDQHKCILSIDGVGAFDNIKRASMLKKLHTLPTASDQGASNSGLPR